jgi:hypothetical protein
LLTEAQAWLANNATPVPWLSGVAVGRQLALEVVANQQVARIPAATYGELTGKRMRLGNDIDLLGPEATLEQLNAIQW